MMRHYSLVPVRYNEQQLLTRCEPIDAELWSIQWAERTEHCTTYDLGSRSRWFADVSPLEYEEAKAIVTWLNNRQSMLATLPPLVDTVRPFRSR